LAVVAPSLGLDCSRCDESLKKHHGFYEETNETEWDIQGTIYKRCPLTQIEPRSYQLLEAYAWMKNGFLPNAGAMLDQPHKFLESMRVIQVTLHDEAKENGNRKSD